MEEIFYFTKNEVNASQIKEICLENGLYYVEILGLDIHVKVYTKLGNEFGEYFKWYDVTNANDIDYLEENLVILEEYQPKVKIMISFHVRNFPLVIRLLKAVMDKYEGWAGCDDVWEKKYYADDIYEMNCFKPKNI